MSEPGDITINLKQWLAGSKEAEDRLYEIVFPKLRELARIIMSRERRGHTLQATELVAEIYFRSPSRRTWIGRTGSTFLRLRRDACGAF